jgi:hypothetical protein
VTPLAEPTYSKWGPSGSRAAAGAMDRSPDLRGVRVHRSLFTFGRISHYLL